jgi:protein-tyrosine phosphatase
MIRRSCAPSTWHGGAVPIDDRAAPTSEQLTEINAWLDSPAGQTPGVYVQCEGGLGRSPTIAIALLMRRCFSRAEAHRFVFGARSVAAPTADQDAWLAKPEREIDARVPSLFSESR